MSRTSVTIASIAALLALSGCSGSSEGGEPVEGESPFEPAPSVFDEVDVLDHLGAEKRPKGKHPEAFEIETSVYADYRWEANDGTVCFFGDVLTSASDAEMASPDAVLNPAGTAGVEFHMGATNMATCTELLGEALADFPS